jgi:PPOX class probable F420-dependent enzyme
MSMPACRRPSAESRLVSPDDAAMFDLVRRLGTRSRTPAVWSRPAPDVERRLRETSVAWLSTSGAHGEPAVVPVWFLWDGEAFLVFSKPHARKVRNVRANPRVMLAIGDPSDDFDVQLVEGRAEVLPAAALDPAELGVGRKYERWLAAIGLGLDEFRATYGQPIRIVPTRFLPWRGRTWIGQGARAPGTQLIAAAGA